MSVQSSAAIGWTGMKFDSLTDRRDPLTVGRTESEAPSNVLIGNENRLSKHCGITANED